MCQHYEHSAAESTIDLDSPHHRCREPGENLLLLRCDDRNHMLPPKEEEHTPPQAWRMQPPSTGSTTSATTDHQYNTVVAPRRPQRPIMRGISTFSRPPTSAPGRTRTGNLRIRRPMLYPLSYGGVREAPHQPTPSTRRPPPTRGTSRGGRQHQKTISRRSRHHDESASI